MAETRHHPVSIRQAQDPGGHSFGGDCLLDRRIQSAYHWRYAPVFLTGLFLSLRTFTLSNHMQ